MKRDIRDAWVKALRSRKYKQTTKRLHRIHPDGTDTYCCLGVLADVAGERFVPMPNSPQCVVGLPVRAEDKRSDRPVVDVAQLPERVVRRVQLTNVTFEEPNLTDSVLRGQGAFIHMNDTLKWSFRKIANWVEKNVPVHDEKVTK